MKNPSFPAHLSLDPGYGDQILSHHPAPEQTLGATMINTVSHQLQQEEGISTLLYWSH